MLTFLNGDRKHGDGASTTLPLTIIRAIALLRARDHAALLFGAMTADHRMAGPRDRRTSAHHGVGAVGAPGWILTMAGTA